MWKNKSGPEINGNYYSILELNADGMCALRRIFPTGQADDMNAALFSTAGIHGTYDTIEAIERNLKHPQPDGPTKLTFLILHPRLVCLRYGICTPKTLDDIEWLKRLRESSRQAFADIG
jgi:hypothetical protein